MRSHLLGWLFLCSFGLVAQKKLHRTIVADHINLIQIDAANCFRVELDTKAGEELHIEAEIEGEYVKDLDLKVRTFGSTYMIEAGFVPSFENPNDKLSAHKVVSILLKIQLPLNKNVTLYGTNSRVVANGVYKELRILLSDGACELNNILGHAYVKTQSGSISVGAKSAVILAESKYGTIEYNPIPNGIPNYELHTITGNIELSKTE